MSEHLARFVDDVAAARQRKAALAATDFIHWESEAQKAESGFFCISGTAAANDNDAGFKTKESWPLMERLNRTDFEPDSVKRLQFKDTITTIRELADTASVDVIGLAVHRAGKHPTTDYDVDRDDNGNTILAFGQSIVRKDGRAKPGYVKSQRVINKSAPVSHGYNADRDDLIAERIIDAKSQLEDLAAVVGPLWLPLLWAILENASFKEVAERLGYDKHVVGSAIIKLALEAANRHLRAMKKVTNFRQYVAETGIPVAASRFQRALKAAA